MLSRFFINRALICMALLFSPSLWILGSDEDDILSDFCRSPDDPILGLEGFIPQNNKFHQVYVFLNSAETFPSFAVKSGTAASYVLNCTYNITQNGCQPGDITNLGALQQTNLGKYISAVYLKHFDVDNITFIAQSTTPSIQSNTAFLKGFYYMNDVPIHLKRIVMMNNACLALKKQLMNGLYNVSKNTRKTLIAENIIHGGNRSVMSSVSFYLCSTSRKPNDNKQNKTLKNIVGSFKELNNYYINVRSIIKKCRECNGCINSFLVYLIKNMKSKTQENSMVIYHLDDDIFTSLLLVLTTEKFRIPRTSSRLIFEVYSNFSSSHFGMRLKVLFNGKDITSKVPLCNRNAASIPCKLKYFIDFHKSQLEE